MHHMPTIQAYPEELPHSTSRDQHGRQPVVSADTMKVLNTPSIEGYKHVLALKHSDTKKVWAYRLRTKCDEEVLKCMMDVVEV